MRLPAHPLHLCPLFWCHQVTVWQIKSHRPSCFAQTTRPARQSPIGSGQLMDLQPRLLGLSDQVAIGLAINRPSKWLTSSPRSPRHSPPSPGLWSIPSEHLVGTANFGRCTSVKTTDMKMTFENSTQHVPFELHVPRFTSTHTHTHT
ncbi:unnamed protein product [Protopolystoma xenopodis]|uniref:Uncharacterized protein n=1 Tax=Protopolystoma xenopodis TaxID=117903 RepID=A0A448XCY9_9PLAT|nr:unnamed protein product [Protopolystoma xenopodis]